MSVVTLRPIGKSNEAACCALRVHDDQLNFIAPNTDSLAWARANPNCVPRAIYAGDSLVGFIMYEPRGNRVFSVHRCMIDAKYQRRGFGRRAFELVIEKIRKQGGITVYTSFRPENDAAKKLYESAGFVYHMTEPDGEIVYRLGPIREIIV